MNQERSLTSFIVKAAVALSVLLGGGCGLGSGFSGHASADHANKNVSAESEPISTLTGDSPNFAQMSNGDLMTVVSRDFGRGAKAGALVELYYPQYATDNLWDSYVGVTAEGSFKWAHQLRLTRQALVPDSGISVSSFQGDGYTLTIEDLVRPHSNAHVRHVTLTNTSKGPLTGLTSTFYAFFMLGGFPGGDRLHFDAQNNALIQSDDGVAVAVTADRATGAYQCGDANLGLGNHRDARMAAEAGVLPGNDQAGPIVTGVNGVMRQSLPTLPAGSALNVTYAIGVAADEAKALGEAQDALKQGWQSLVAEDTTRWSTWLSRAKQPASMPDDVRSVYHRALITLEQEVNQDGGIIAAPTNLDPPYRFVWPRDGTMISLAFLDAGYTDEAKRFFSFVEERQRADGGWAVNYFPDGSKPLWEFGPKGDEHDEVGTFAWGVNEVYKRTQDDAWLQACWPHVKSACDFLLGVQQSNGLVSNCRDLWELNTDGTWTYSNAADWAGLMAGATIADKMGDPADAARYRAAAQAIHDAMEQRLVANGVFARGLRKGGLDTTIEAANLALGSVCFNAFSDADPRMRALADAITHDLGTPLGGIRRYQGDQYYNGQPWPVATNWLADYRLSVGDRASAQALFNTVIGYAHRTDALMLGEQFDETHKRWVSAFPLAWSEATMVQTALKLYAD